MNDASAQVQLTINADTLTFDLDRAFNFIPATIVNRSSVPIALVGFRNYAEIADFSSDSLLLKHANIGFTFLIQTESGRFVFDPQFSEPACHPELDGSGCEMNDRKWARLYHLKYVSNYAERGTDKLLGYTYVIMPGEVIDMQILVFIEDNFSGFGNIIHDVTLYYIVNETMYRYVEYSDTVSIPNLFMGLIKSEPVKLRIR